MNNGTALKVAAVQMEPRLLDKERNLERCLEFARTAAAEGARLIVLPECALTGYVFHSLEEALPVCEAVPGPSTERIATAVLLGPEGIAGRYRKIHLPYLGIDRFLDHGDSAPAVFDTAIARIGIGICYDAMFPEHARVLALLEADIIVLPTNWPQHREFIPEHIIPARAAENRIFIVAANRVGQERSARFIGHSVIAHCARGEALATGGPDEEAILYAEIDPALAREKHVIISPGEFEFDVRKDRRPDLYGAITEPPAPP